MPGLSAGAAIVAGRSVSAAAVRSVSAEPPPPARLTSEHRHAARQRAAAPDSPQRTGGAAAPPPSRERPLGDQRLDALVQLPRRAHVDRAHELDQLGFLGVGWSLMMFLR